MCSFPLRNPADGYLIVSQENGGCDASCGFGYYIRAWPALPITIPTFLYRSLKFSITRQNNENIEKSHIQFWYTLL